MIKVSMYLMDRDFDTLELINAKLDETPNARFFMGDDTMFAIPQDALTTGLYGMGIDGHRLAEDLNIAINIEEMEDEVLLHKNIVSGEGVTTYFILLKGCPDLEFEVIHKSSSN